MPIYTKQDLLLQLEKAGIKKDGILLVHLSLKSMGKLENRADTLLDALMEYKQDGLLVIPTHTWNNVTADSDTFDVTNTVSCVGITPEIFRKRAGVVRTLHPTHSLGVYGKGATEFAQGQEKFNTPCAPKSCYGKLIDQNAQVLLIGVDFGRNTSVHCIEEIAGVPNRLKEIAEQHTIIDKDGNKTTVQSYRHNNANSDLYVKLEPVMKKLDVLHEVQLGDALCLCFFEQDLLSVTINLLNKDIHLLDDDKPIDKSWYQYDIINENNQFAIRQASCFFLSCTV